MNIFNAFGMRDLQRVLLILDMAEGEGVTEMQALKGKIVAHVEGEYVKVRGTRIKGRVLRRRYATPCPECGAQLSPVRNADGLIIVGCKRCRYSSIVG